MEDDQKPAGNTQENRPPVNLGNRGKLTPEMEARKWKPGQSGNLSGRPKKTPLNDAMVEMMSRPFPNDREGRTYAQVIVQKVVIEALKGKLPAVKELIDRTEGCAISRSEHTGKDGAPLFMPPSSREELEQRIADLLSGNKAEETETP